MKKILIVPSNTDLNRGDQSLTWATIDLVKNIYEKKKFEVLLYENKTKKSKFTNEQTSKLGYEFLTRILAHPGRNDKESDVRFSKLRIVKWGFIALSDFFVTALLLFPVNLLNRFGYFLLAKEKRNTYKEFQKLDSLFVKGGGFLHSYGSVMDPYVMYFQLFDVMLANKLGIKVFIMPNSIGPLKNRLAKRIVLNVLQKCEIVFVREGVSASFLRENNIRCTESPDLGFYLNASNNDYRLYLKDIGVDLKKKNIAITLRPYRFDGKENAVELYEAYINNFTSVIETLVNRGYGVTLVAHTIGPSAHEDDRIPLREIYDKLKNKKDLNYLDDKELNCMDLEKIYSYFDLVIGTRFHSVIFALNVSTPAIAIAYGGNKANGIMFDMNLKEYVVPIENPNPELILFLVDKVFMNYDAYKTKISEYKKILKTKRDELILDVRNILLS